MTKYIEINGIGEFVPRSEYDALVAQVLKLEKRIKAINEGINEYKLMTNDATAD